MSSATRRELGSRWATQRGSARNCSPSCWRNTSSWRAPRSPCSATGAFWRRGERIAGVRLDLPKPLRPMGRPWGSPSFIDLMHLDPASVTPGEASAEGGAFAMRNFRKRCWPRAGRLDAVMFTPFNKLALKRGGNPYPDEIRWAADVLQWKGSCSEYNKLDGLWNARVTSHEPMRDVPALLTRERIGKAIRQRWKCCRHQALRDRASRCRATIPCWRGRSFRTRGDRRDRACRRGRAARASTWRGLLSRHVWLKARRGEYVQSSACITIRDRSRSSFWVSSAASNPRRVPIPIATPARHGLRHCRSRRGGSFRHDQGFRNIARVKRRKTRLVGRLSTFDGDRHG